MIFMRDEYDDRAFGAASVTLWTAAIKAAESAVDGRFTPPLWDDVVTLARVLRAEREAYEWASARDQAMHAFRVTRDDGFVHEIIAPDLESAWRQVRHVGPLLSYASGHISQPVAVECVACCWECVRRETADRAAEESVVRGPVAGRELEADPFAPGEREWGVWDIHTDHAVRVGPEE